MIRSNQFQSLSDLLCVIAIVFVMIIALITGIQGEAEFAYRKCLNWEKQGYPVKCNRNQNEGE